MLKRYKEWKKKRYHNQYNAGYDFAVGMLIRGEITPLYLQMEYENNPDFSPFDHGIRDAIYKVCELCPSIKDDRI